jgi:hypothetical protein
LLQERSTVNHTLKELEVRESVASSEEPVALRSCEPHKGHSPFATSRSTHMVAHPRDAELSKLFSQIQELRERVSALAAAKSASLRRGDARAQLRTRPQQASSPRAPVHGPPSLPLSVRDSGPRAVKFVRGLRPSAPLVLDSSRAPACQD